MKFLKNNLKVIIAFILGLILAGGIVYAATSAKEVTYTTAKNGNIKNVEDALNDLYKNNKGGTVAFYSSVFDGTTTSLRDISLVNRNNDFTEMVDGSLIINKKGQYKAYLSVAHGRTDGNHGSRVYLYIDDVQVSSAYFDRVSSIDTGTVCYDFTVNENQRKKINFKLSSSDNFNAGYSAAPGSLIIVKE